MTTEIGMAILENRSKQFGICLIASFENDYRWNWAHNKNVPFRFVSFRLQSNDGGRGAHRCPYAVPCDTDVPAPNGSYLSSERTLTPTQYMHDTNVNCFDALIYVSYVH